VDLIVDFLLAQVKRRHRVDLSENQIVHLRLREAAEKAKAELSSAPTAPLRVLFLEMGIDGPIHLSTTLTAAKFHKITGKPPGRREPPGPSDAVEPPKPSPDQTSPVRPTPTLVSQARRRPTKASPRPAAASRPAHSSTSPSRIVAALVTVLLVCVGAGIWRDLSRSSKQADGCVTAVDCASQVVADFVEAVEGTQFLEVYLGSQGHAKAAATSASGATTVESLTWMDGDVARVGSAADQPEDLRNTLFDVTAVDWASVEKLIAQMPQLAGFVEEDQHASVTVSRSRFGDVGISLKYCGAHVIADPSGRIVRMTGFDRGSPAATWEVAGFYAFVPQVVDDFVTTAGSTQFVDFRFISYYAQATAQTGPGTGDELSWDDGVVNPSFTGLLVDQDALFDVTTVDWTVAGKLAAQIPTLTLAPSDTERGIKDLTLRVHRPTSDQERRATTEVVFVFTAKSDDTATTIVADATGKVVWMNGGTPGSPASTWAADHP